MIIQEWHDIILLAISGISLFGAMYTIALITWVTPKSMSEYRWFLLLYTFWDAIFTLMFGIILCPKFLFPGTGCVMQGLGRDLFYVIKNTFGDGGGDIIVKLGFMGTTWFVVNIISSQDYCLIYRFTVVHPNQRFHDILVNKKVVAVTLIFGVLLCPIFSVPCFIYTARIKDVPHLLKEYEKKYPNTFYDITDDDVIVWLDNGKDGQKSFLLFGLIFAGFVISEIAAVSSVFFILKILRKNAASFSAQTYKLHRQLTVLLIIQIANPFIFIIFPIAACIVGVIFNLNFQRRTGIYGTLFMSFYTISNTILTIGFVSPYRQFTLGIILKLPFLKKYQIVTPVAPIASTSGTSFNTRLIRHQ